MDDDWEADQIIALLSGFESYDFTQKLDMMCREPMLDLPQIDTNDFIFLPSEGSDSESESLTSMPIEHANEREELDVMSILKISQEYESPWKYLLEHNNGHSLLELKNLANIDGEWAKDEIRLIDKLIQQNKTSTEICKQFPNRTMKPILQKINERKKQLEPIKTRQSTRAKLDAERKTIQKGKIIKDARKPINKDAPAQVTKPKSPEERWTPALNERIKMHMSKGLTNQQIMSHFPTFSHKFIRQKISELSVPTWSPSNIQQINDMLDNEKSFEDILKAFPKFSVSSIVEMIQKHYGIQLKHESKNKDSWEPKDDATIKKMLRKKKSIHDISDAFKKRSLLEVRARVSHLLNQDSSLLKDCQRLIHKTSLSKKQAIEAIIWQLR